MRWSYIPSIILISLCPTIGAQEWREGFETGIATAKPYHAGEQITVLEIGSDTPAEGKQFIRARLAGKKRLEGFYLVATGLTGGRLATVTAKARGRGELWLCLISSNGWLYSPHTALLTEQWQEVSLSKALMEKDKSLGIYFISKGVQAGAVFEVDDVRVTLAPAPQTYDAQVGPWLLEAEDFSRRQSYVGEDNSASGGKIARDSLYFCLTGLPFPHTTLPVTVYLRVKAGCIDENFRLCTTQGGNSQTVSKVQPKSLGKWQWLSFPPCTTGEIGDSFDVHFNREKGAGSPTAIDAVVLSTNSNLDDVALQKAPPLFANHPMVAVSRTSKPPTIDGKADDACWRNTVACSDFLGLRSLVPAQAKTIARLCYDDRNLYILLECEEPILETAMQRRHEFSAKIQQRDGEVYQDDSCVILLRPSQSNSTVFDFTVNALGIIADARCTGEDLWGSRDINWNSTAIAAGNIGEKSWCAEMAIPFANLSVKTPTPGTIWQACLGRIARARSEQTSWNPCGLGFHAPIRWGALLFAGQTPGVTLNAPNSIQVGKNRLTAALFPCDTLGGLYLMSVFESPVARVNSYKFVPLGKVPSEATHEFEVSDEGNLQAYGALDAASLTPLCLSAQVERRVKSSLATLTLSCDGPYGVFMNAELIGRGDKADTAEIIAPLQKGANLFAIRLEKGTAAIRLVAPGMENSVVNWRINAADVRDAALPSTDDSTWKTAAKVGEHPKLGPVIGEPGKPVILRHTLLWDKTRTWPTPIPALYIARNSNQHITFIADGLRGRKFVDWTTYLAVPPEFEILGSTGYYANSRPELPHYICTQLGEQVIGGRKMHVAKIVADKPILSIRYSILSVFNIFVRYRDDAPPLPNRETGFIYWSEANDRTVSEPPQRIPVRLLPPLNGLQPKRLVWQLWGYFFGSMDDEKMRLATLQTMQTAGMNDLVAGDQWTSDLGPRYGIKNTMCVNFESWSLNLTPYLKDHPTERLINNEGKPKDGLLCTTLLVAERWPVVEEQLKAKIEKARPHTMDYDYEYGPFSGPHSCYCPRCLAAFKDYAKLSDDVQLSPQIIKEKYASQWIDFMAWRVAQIFAKFKETIHRLAPGTNFSVYSGYQTPDNAERYGVDWAHVGKLQACDRVGCGYGRPAEYLPITLKALQGIPALFGALLTPYDIKETIPQAPITKATLLRLALDATGGVLVYNRLPMDGRTWLAIADTTRLVAEFEEAFLNGKRMGLPGLDEANVQLLVHNTSRLLCVMNPTSKSIQMKISFPDGVRQGTEYYTGHKIVGKEPLLCALEPGETAVYILEE